MVLACRWVVIGLAVLGGAIQQKNPKPSTAHDLDSIVRSMKHAELETAFLSKQIPSVEDCSRALVIAVSIGDPRAVKLLLAHNANANYWSSRTGSPLAAACFADRPSIVSLLLNAGSSPNSLGPSKCPAVCAARSAGTMQLLIAAGANLERACPDGQRAIHAACSSGNPALVSLLVEHHADPNAKDHHGNTPLIYLCFNDPDALATETFRIKVFRILKRSGAKLDLRNSAGLAAIDYARSNRLFRLAAELARSIKDQPAKDGAPLPRTGMWRLTPTTRLAA